MIPKIVLDPWQQAVLDTEGDICLRSGRQVGKSFIISLKAAQYAIKHPNKTILVIASVERQAYLLFEKILAYLSDHYKSKIKKGKDRPTKHKLVLTNGSTIYSLPTGLSGYGIRGYTIDLLIADEAAFIPEDVWTAVTPMIAVTKGNIILLSTPHGKEGFYYNCFKEKGFTSFHVSSEDCPRMDLNWLAREKARMTKVQYAQEYLGEFIDELRQFFSSDLIKANMILPPKQNNLFSTILTNSGGEYYLGVDFAGYGGDENAFVVVKKVREDRVEMIEYITTTGEEIKDNITGDTLDKIKLLDKKYNFKKIYVDDGGLGSPIFDMLKELDGIRRKVEALNNARRSIEWQGKAKKYPREKHIMKEDLYGNLLRLMENKAIALLQDPDVNLSLKSIQYEYTKDKNIKIFGNYTHITEALIRAVWCVKDKTLNIYIS